MSLEHSSSMSFGSARALVETSDEPAVVLTLVGDLVCSNAAFDRMVGDGDPRSLLPHELFDDSGSNLCDSTYAGVSGSGVESWRTTIFRSAEQGTGVVIAKGAAAPLVDEDSSLFRAIFDHSHLLVAYLDRQLRFVRVNETYAAADGHEPEYFVGKGHFELYPHIQNEQVFRRVLETGEPHFERAKPFQYAHAPERGISYWDWTLVPLVDGGVSGRPSGLILTLVDVTERVHSIERLHQLSEQREDLLREVHHRVKNNLQVVASLLSLQECRVSDEASREALRDSRRRVRAIGLVHDRLNSAQGVSRVPLADFCRSLVRDLVEAFAWRGAPELRFAVESTIELPPSQTTPVMLILNELVSNALSHAFPRGAPGTVEVGAARLVDGRVELWVQDDGEGLSADFDWEDHDTLGLRLVRRLAGQIGGEVLVNPSRPTRFAVRFGLALGSAGPVE